jgi:hypothetical protein
MVIMMAARLGNSECCRQLSAKTIFVFVTKTAASEEGMRTQHEGHCLESYPSLTFLLSSALFLGM